MSTPAQRAASARNGKLGGRPKGSTRRPPRPPPEPATLPLKLLSDQQLPSIEFLVWIRDSSDFPPDVRLRAAENLLDRGGHGRLLKSEQIGEVASRPKLVVLRDFTRPKPSGSNGEDERREVSAATEVKH